MTSLLIGTPCYNGWATAEYTLSLLGMQRELIRRGIEFTVEMTTTVSLIPIARNFIASKVLEDKSITHLLFIDADLRFDAQLALRLLQADKDVVAGIYPLKHLDIPAVRQLPPEQPLASAFNYAVGISPGAVPQPDGFVRADYAATGFMLIRRQVLERMAAHYRELKYTEMFAPVRTEVAVANDHLYALFDSTLEPETGRYVPEDYTFCKRWRAIGGEIWVDILSPITHVGTFAYQGDFSVFVKRS